MGRAPFRVYLLYLCYRVPFLHAYDYNTCAKRAILKNFVASPPRNMNTIRYLNNDDLNSGIRESEK